MKQKKQFFAMLSLLAASILCYAAAGLVRTPEIKPAAAEEAQDVFEFNPSEIQSLSWNNGKEDMTVTRQGDSWILEEHPDFPLQKGRIDDMTDALRAMKSERTVTENDLSRFGLDPPQYTLDAEMKDGRKLTVRIGSKASVGDAYYVQTEEDGAVRLVQTTLPPMLEADILKFARMETMPQVADPSQVKITLADGDGILLLKPENAEEYSYSSYYAWFTEKDGTYRELDTKKAEQLANIVLHPKWRSVEGYNTEDLSLFGLDSPAVKAEVTDGRNKAVLLLGNSAGEDSCYAAPENSGMVYTVSKADFETLYAASYENLRAEDICRMDWDTVEKMTFAAGGTTREIVFETAGENPEGRKYRYTDGGRELDYETVARIREMIDKMVPAKQLEEDIPELQEEPVLKITFSRNTADFSEMDLEFFRYNEYYDLIRFNGEARQLISSHAAESVIRLNEMLGQEEN